MASVSAEQNAHRLKLSHPKLFADICYTHAGWLLAVSDRCHVVRLLGDVQGPAADPLVSHAPVANTRKLFKGIILCLCYI